MDYNNGGSSNRNEWDKWNSNSSHNSYYNQPTHSPHKGRGFEYASFICGLVSVSFLCTGILSLPVGALGILFALLTRRTGKKMSHMSHTGVWLSGVGMAVGGFITISTLFLMPAYMQTQEYQDRLNIMYERMFGMNYEEFMQQYQNISSDNPYGQNFN